MTTPIRIADVVSGHVHPALARTSDGQLLAVYNIEGGGGKELLLCRSDDGGRSWSTPKAISEICDCSIYPGSLSTLSDGRLLLNFDNSPPEGFRRRGPHKPPKVGGLPWRPSKVCEKI